MSLQRTMLRSAAGWMLAFVVIAQGCQSDTRTDGWRARCGERFAMDAVACCKESSAVAQDRCVVALLERMDAVENDLELLDAARHAGNQQVASQLLERLAAVVGNVVVVGADGAPANGLPVLRGTDTIRCDLRWSRIEAAIGRESHGPQSHRWELAPGSMVAASVSGLPVEVQVAGAIAFSDEVLPLEGGPARLPTSAGLIATWAGQRVRLALDETCTWNRVTATHLYLGLRPVEVDPRVRAELSLYPTVFVALPFAMSDDRSATSVTKDSVPGTRLFPSYFGSFGARGFDSGAGPNCGDADSDGIPNIAEQIRQSYERLIADPGAGRKGT